MVGAACSSKNDPNARPATSGSNTARPAGAGPADTGFDVSEVPGRIHRVQTGDTLWSLAETYYGDNRHWRRILTANRNRVKQPSDLEVGMKLIIP